MTQVLAISWPGMVSRSNKARRLRYMGQFKAPAGKYQAILPSLAPWRQQYGRAGRRNFPEGPSGNGSVIIRFGASPHLINKSGSLSQAFGKPMPKPPRTPN